ncbi:MAG: hypothetical protein LBJ14_09135 [Desulfarculales bacterium]|jgi:hypothetical protein|nr:hypothetical protein [Desulfarculales bacterium]
MDPEKVKMTFSGEKAYLQATLESGREPSELRLQRGVAESSAALHYPG